MVESGADFTERLLRARKKTANVRWKALRVYDENKGRRLWKVYSFDATGPGVFSTKLPIIQQPSSFTCLSHLPFSVSDLTRGVINRTAKGDKRENIRCRIITVTIVKLSQVACIKGVIGSFVCVAFLVSHLSQQFILGNPVPSSI